MERVWEYYGGGGKIKNMKTRLTPTGKTGREVTEGGGGVHYLRGALKIRG